MSYEARRALLRRLQARRVSAYECGESVKACVTIKTRNGRWEDRWTTITSEAQAATWEAAL